MMKKQEEKMMRKNVGEKTTRGLNWKFESEARE